VHRHALSPFSPLQKRLQARLIIPLRSCSGLSYRTLTVITPPIFCVIKLNMPVKFLVMLNWGSVFNSWTQFPVHVTIRDTTVRVDEESMLSLSKSISAHPSMTLLATVTLIGPVLGTDRVLPCALITRENSP